MLLCTAVRTVKVRGAEGTEGIWYVWHASACRDACSCMRHAAGAAIFWFLQRVERRVSASACTAVMVACMAYGRIGGAGGLCGQNGVTGAGVSYIVV